MVIVLFHGEIGKSRRDLPKRVTWQLEKVTFLTWDTPFFLGVTLL
jgi:hypothetical protein